MTRHRPALVITLVALALLGPTVSAFSTLAQAQTPQAQLATTAPDARTIGTDQTLGVRGEVIGIHPDGRTLENQEVAVDTYLIFTDNSFLPVVHCWDSANQVWAEVGSAGGFPTGCQEVVSCNQADPSEACIYDHPAPAVMPPVNATSRAEEPAGVSLIITNYTVSLGALANDVTLTTSIDYELYNGTNPAFLNTHEPINITGFTSFDTRVNELILVGLTVLAFWNGWIFAGAFPWVAAIGSQMVDPGDLTYTLGYAGFALGIGLELVAHRFALGQKIRGLFGRSAE